MLLQDNNQQQDCTRQDHGHDRGEPAGRWELTGENINEFKKNFNKKKFWCDTLPP